LSLKVGLRAVDLADEGMVLYIGHAAVRAMPPLRGELLRSNDDGAARWIVKMRTLDEAAVYSMEKYVYAKASI